MLSDHTTNELDARIDHADRTDDHGRHRLVAVSDRPDDRGVVGVLPDVATTDRDPVLLEAPTEPLDEWSTGPPEDLDRLDRTG
ncbi:MAG: hypothetical protein AAF533_30890, partial [Acidobacteriota bacterium]